MPAFAQSERVTAQDARLAGDSFRTRLIVDLSAPIDFYAFSLMDPYRIIIDMPEIGFAIDPKKGEAGKGLVKEFRYGRFAAGRSRMVLDLSEPALIDKAFILEAVESQPARLVIDLVSGDREAFITAMEAQERKGPVFNAADNEQIAEAKRRQNQPQEKGEKPVIVIDPGHGGIDSGAIGARGTKEKDLVLSFSLALKDALMEEGRYEIFLTRRDDSFIPLNERVQFARDFHADLFISIHADSISEHPELRGATVYTLSDRASDEIARRLAESENKADILAGLAISDVDSGDVADILLDLTRRETKNYSIRFARDVIDEIASSSEMVRNPHRYAGFRVLKAPDVPSVLLEMGFLSNVDDEKLMQTEQWRDMMLASLMRSIDVFFEQRVAQGPY